MVAFTITFTTGRGTVSYSALQPPSNQSLRGIAGGLLGGDPSLVAIVRQILTGNLPRSVRVAEPDINYHFSAGRDTVADVAAAMLVAGNGRGRLSDAGWDALDAAMVSDAHTQTIRAAESVSDREGFAVDRDVRGRHSSPRVETDRLS